MEKVMMDKAKKGNSQGSDSQKQTEPRKQLFLSLRWKLLISFTVVFTIIFAIAFYWFYGFATRQANARIQADLLDTLQGGADNIDAESLVSVAQDGVPNEAGEAWLAASVADENETSDAPELFEYALANFGDPNHFSDDSRYLELMDQLQQIHDIEPRAWPYLYVKGPEEGQITYIADLWSRYDPSKAVPFQFTKSSRRSINGLNELTLRLDENDQFVPYTDDWGQWVSAYRPVLNASGASAGAIGIDFEASYVYEVQRGIRDRVWIAFGITYVSIFVVVFLLARTLTRPIQSLTESAERLGEGDYSQDITRVHSGGITRDEIVTLADVFAIMASKVYKREQTLRKQVEALKIEIDESKRSKQVSEIAETDFFRDLQSKARGMRKRAKGS
jgi:hypothetical protein